MALTGDERPKEKCPACGLEHEVPNLVIRGNKASYYPLVTCACGALLETHMPAIKETESGFVFRNIKRIEPS